mmetsp:Transcript_39666/g.47680  ORF Transcript_39666/g.47680 Transcript_39666/m.47680 type:complete len:228 (-) Transcript_39666:1747-2430(-)
MPLTSSSRQAKWNRFSSLYSLSQNPILLDIGLTVWVLPKVSSITLACSSLMGRPIFSPLNTALIGPIAPNNGAERPTYDQICVSSQSSHAASPSISANSHSARSMSICPISFASSDRRLVKLLLSTFSVRGNFPTSPLLPLSPLLLTSIVSPLPLLFPVIESQNPSIFETMPLSKRLDARLGNPPTHPGIAAIIFSFPCFLKTLLLYLLSFPNDVNPPAEATIARSL